MSASAGTTRVPDPVLPEGTARTLVITDSGTSGRNALPMSARDAMIYCLDSDSDESDVVGQFDSVIIDRDPFDPLWLNRAVTLARAVMSPGDHLIITFDPLGSAPVNTSHEAPALSAYSWRGLSQVKNHLYADLCCEGEEASPVSTALLMGIESGLRAVNGFLQSSVAYAVDQTHARVRDQLDEWQRSEDALLNQLQMYATELDKVRKDHRGLRLVRTVLMRHRLGRVILRVSRPGWRLIKPLVQRAQGARDASRARRRSSGAEVAPAITR